MITELVCLNGYNSRNNEPISIFFFFLTVSVKKVLLDNLEAIKLF